jgi:hypothetical protein
MFARNPLNLTAWSLLTLSLAGCGSSFGGFSKSSKVSKSIGETTKETDTNTKNSPPPSAGAQPSPEDVNFSSKGANFPGDAPTAKQIEALCSTKPLKMHKQDIRFEDPQKVCAFGTEPNLSRKNSYFRADYTQKVAVNLPAGALICDMKFDFLKQKARYDDEILLLMNDHILASSYDFPGKFPKKNGLQVYDFMAIRDLPYKSENSPDFCLGKESGQGNCEIPATDSDGEMKLEFSQQLIFPLSESAAKDKAFEFRFVTLGDNDDSDCQHLDVKFQVDVVYVEK